MCWPASAAQHGRYGLAWLDLSAGRFSVMELPTMARPSRRSSNGCAPRSCWRRMARQPPRRGHGIRTPWRLRSPWHFDAESATRALSEQFRTRDLAGFGCADKPLAVAAAGALLAYVRETQKSALPHLLSLTTEERDGALIMDPPTRRNLELDESLAGKPELTLAGVFDRTVDGHGRTDAAPLAAPPAARSRDAARALPSGGGPDRRIALRCRSRNPCALSATWSGSWRGSRCARRGRAIWCSCALRSGRCRRCGSCSHGVQAQTPSPLLKHAARGVQRSSRRTRAAGSRDRRLAAALSSRRRRDRARLRCRAR